MTSSQRERRSRSRIMIDLAIKCAIAGLETNC